MCLQVTMVQNLVFEETKRRNKNFTFIAAGNSRHTTGANIIDQGYL